MSPQGNTVATPVIPLARTWMDDREADAARRAILSGWITQGPEVAAFEREFAEAVAAPYACAVSSCTTALHLALVALGIGPGDEVVTVSHSFIAAANVIRQSGATPVFVDICLDTLNIDPALVERALSPRTKAILAVHQLGMPFDVPAVLALATRRGIPLIEDAACAAGSEIRIDGAWERIGAPRGDIACFSFHPRKVLSTGDGGMITTRDGALDREFRLLRQHGMSVPDSVRHGASTVIFETYPVVGFNYRLTDIQAAIGREQLRRLPEMVERRRTLAARYRERLSALSQIVVAAEPEWARSNWQTFHVRLCGDLDQRTVMQRMLDAGISTRRGVMNAHREAAYPAGTWSSPGPLRCSELAQDRCIMLPLYHQMTDADQDRVITTLTAIVSAT
jgi:dTDP-4-amino-4,6-dideoxygalactose transaminase